MAQELDRVSGRVVNVPDNTGGGDQEATNQDDNQQQEDKWAGLNLDDNPNFRKHKSVMDKKIAEAQEENARLRHEYEQMQEQWNQARLSTMNEKEALAFRAELAEAKAARIQQEMQMRDEARAREQTLRDIASRGNIPSEMLLEAADPFQALNSVVDYFVSQGMSGQQAVQAAQAVQAVQNEPQNNVDTGTGRVPQVKSGLQERYDRAYEKMDTLAVLDIMAEADRKGVVLKERTWDK